jgi:hypothetical protein
MMACPQGTCHWFIAAGPSFGGPDVVSHRQCCCYQCGHGRAAGAPICGCCGGFPGGGGAMSVMTGDAHCDGCSCSGKGGNGLIKITY